MEKLPAQIEPSAFARRILLTAIGRTPQVLTETLYALAVGCASQRFIPTEIHVITTEEGRRQVELDLMDEGHMRLRQFYEDYELDRRAMRFDAACVHVIRDASSRPLEDIRTADDNERAADAIVQLVRQLTSDPTSALHVSLAGGRKTMGFYLGYALSLFGRPQDRLSHVLVDPRFENLPDFFFPTPTSRILRLRDGKGTVDARTAQVELAQIPVVSLRGLLGAELLGDDSAAYAEIVRRARRQIAVPPQLTVDLRGMRVVAGGLAVALKAPEFIWYALFAQRARDGADGIGWRNLDSRDAVRELHDLVDRVQWLGADRIDVKSWTEGAQLSIEAADRIRSRLNKQLRTALGPGPSGPYVIQREGSRAASRYRLRLAPHCIAMV